MLFGLKAGHPLVFRVVPPAGRAVLLRGVVHCARLRPERCVEYAMAHRLQQPAQCSACREQTEPASMMGHWLGFPATCGQWSECAFCALWAE